MRFVNNDRVFLRLNLPYILFSDLLVVLEKVLRVAEKLHDHRELLYGRDDDFLTRNERFRKLPGLFIDALYNALLMLELVDVLLQLRVKSLPVGDHNHGVIYGVVIVIMERHEAMGKPGYCV